MKGEEEKMASQLKSFMHMDVCDCIFLFSEKKNKIFDQSLLRRHINAVFLCFA